MYYANLVDSVYYSSANDIRRKKLETYETKINTSLTKLFLYYFFFLSYLALFLCFSAYESRNHSITCMLHILIKSLRYSLESFVTPVVL